MPNQISDRVLGEVEKNSFMAFPGKGRQCGLLPWKLCPNPGSSVRQCFKGVVADKIGVCKGPALPLISVNLLNEFL